MFRKLGLLGAALALFSLAGGQWAVLQSAAWAGMLWQYTQTSGSLSVAIGQTFDGQHPCELCRTIAVAKSKARPGSPAAPGTKKEAPAKALLAERLPGLTPLLSARPFVFPAGFSSCPNHTETPPTPPPRLGAVAA